MPKWNPCKRRVFVKKLVRLGFNAPEPGGRDFYMRYGTKVLTIPSNDEYSVPAENDDQGIGETHRKNNYSGRMGRTLTQMFFERKWIARMHIRENPCHPCSPVMMAAPFRMRLQGLWSFAIFAYFAVILTQIFHHHAFPDFSSSST
jgi:hypothetical protein